MPKFKCWEEDHGSTEDDARIFETYDHKEASADFIEWSECRYCEYPVASGGEAIVSVREDDGPIVKVRVTGRIEAIYSGSVIG